MQVECSCYHVSIYAIIGGSFAVRMGLHVFLYINDGICGAPTKEKCGEHKELIISDLERGGAGS